MVLNIAFIDRSIAQLRAMYRFTLFLEDELVSLLKTLLWLWNVE